MSNNIKYRPSCASENNYPNFGGCGNHNSASAKILQNVTQYVNYDTTSLTASIAPYPYINAFDLVDCAVNFGYTCPTNQIPCGIPALDVCQPSGSDYSSFTVGPYTNYYAPSDITQSVDCCDRQVGFKNAYAKKNWQGRFGYNSRTWAVIDNFLWCGNCVSHNLDSGVDNIKYLAMQTSADYSNSDNVGNSVSATAENDIHIDKHSGNLIVDTFSSSSTDGTTSTAAIAQDLLNIVNGSIIDLYNVYTSTIGGLISGDYITHDNASDGSHSFTFAVIEDCDGNPHVNITVNVDTSAGTLDIVTVSTGADGSGCPPFNQTETTHYSIGDTTYEFTYENDTNPSHSVDVVETKSATGILSSPYTAEKVYQDAVQLLSFLPLDNDGLLPWRTGSNVTQGPIVYYDEQQQTLNVPTSTSNTGSSGMIYGKPAPSGVDFVWDPSFKNWCVCTDIESGITCPYISTYGGDNTCIGGGSATQWTDAMDSSNLIQGAFISNDIFQVVPCSADPTPGIQPINVLWVGKWAELLIPKQSYNFARPCGEDRFAVIGSASYCASGSTGTNIDFTNTGTPITLADNQFVWACGIEDNVDGCYQITKTGDYSIDLTTLIISGSLLPSSSLDCGQGLVAPLQWQNAQGLNPAICGQIDILKATNNSPVTCSLAFPGYLVDDDTVTIKNAKGMNINGNWSVKIIDYETIALQGSDGTNQTYLGNGVISSPFAASPEWNDTSTKGEYTIIEWNWNYRSIGEYLRLSASAASLIINTTCDNITPCSPNPVPPNPAPNNTCYPQGLQSITTKTDCVPFNCGPNVAFFSPNKETFNTSGSHITSKNYWNFNYTSLDMQYGTLLQGLVLQEMVDPLWIQPPCPCALDNGKYDCKGFVWIPDDGSGNEDSPLATPPEKFYARPPVFEARDSSPEDAPGLPSGYFLGCLQPSAANVSCSNGQICVPPFNNALALYTVNRGNSCGAIVNFPYTLPWIRYGNEHTDVCTHGRFSDVYKKNGVICSSCNPEQYSPPP